MVAYELEMWPRAAKVAKLSHDVTKAWMFTPDVPRSVVARTTAMHARVPHTLDRPSLDNGNGAYHFLCEESD